MSPRAAAPGEDARLGLARGLLAEGRADEAALVLRRVALERPGEPGVLAALARAHAAEDRPLDRLSAARGVAAARPGGLDPALALADALEGAGRRGEADALLAATAERHAAAAAPRAARARLAERRQSHDLAADLWRAVLALEPDDLPARLGVARALRGAGRFAEAEAACRALHARLPDEPGPLAELARVAQDASEPVLAEARWRRAASRAKRPLEALLGLAQALAAQHRFADARALLTRLRQAHPATTEPAVALARTLVAEGDLEPAEAAYRDLVAREPGRTAHRLALGRVLEQRADHAAAEAIYAEAARERPQAAAPRLALADLALALGEAVAAGTAYHGVLELDPEHLDARFGLAAAAADRDDLDEARRWLAEAEALAPASPRVHQRRVQLAEHAGRLEEARLLLLEARSAMPHREQPLLWLVAFALRQGELEAALGHAGTALKLRPRSLATTLAAFDARLAAGRHEAARELLNPLAESLPEHREVQKRLARLETLDGDAARARRRWWRIARLDPRIHGPVDRLERLDRHPLPPPDGEVRVFLVVRNERTRLPWLLDYYRRQGADRFLVLDNASDDGTTEWLLAQGPDVHLFFTQGSYGRSASGIRWLHQLLDDHGTGAWVLNVDGDEALVYPRCEDLPLGEFTRWLDRQGAEAVLAPMLDMYAAAPMDELTYEPGASLIDTFPYFDPTGYLRRDSHTFPFVDLHGGCRDRMFYPVPGAGPVMQKVPLLRWSPEMRYLSGRHTAMPCRLAAASGLLLHFKYTPEFSAYVRAEVARGEHYKGGLEYRVYLKRLEAGDSLSFLHPGSARYAGSRQLVDLGLMRSTPELDAHVVADDRRRAA